MKWLRNLFKRNPVLTEKDVEWYRKFDERYGERMKKPGILSNACPNCGREFGWLNLEAYIGKSRRDEESKIPALDLFDYRWICLNCLHIWIDSEHEDPNGWWHTHSSKEEHLQSLESKAIKEGED